MPRTIRADSSHGHTVSTDTVPQMRWVLTLSLDPSIDNREEAAQ